MKQVVSKILKTVAGIAGFVFLVAPISDMGILVSLAALMVAIITGVVGIHLNDDEDHSGYWPTDPNSPGSR